MGVGQWEPPERFDSFARALATRRTALRGGAGIAAALLGIVGLRSANGRRHVRRSANIRSVRRYALSGKASDAGKALKGSLVSSIEYAPGFVDYSVVDSGGGT